MLKLLVIIIIIIIDATTVIIIMIHYCASCIISMKIDTKLYFQSFLCIFFFMWICIWSIFSEFIV